MPETQVTVDAEVKARLQMLENLKAIFISQFSGKVEVWDGTSGPMYNLHFRNPNAESPVKQMENREGKVVEIKTIADLTAQVVENLRHSGYWINFIVKRPDARGVVTPQTITMWSYAKQGFIVCKGRESFTDSSIEGSVAKSEPKAPKLVDASGKEVVGANLKLSFSGFGNSGANKGVEIG